MSLLEAAGAQARNPSRGKPIHISRMETGLFTNRSPLHDPASWYVSKYGGYPDALWDGSNMEVSNQLTLVRRPGLSQWSNQTVANQPNWFYDWRTLDQGIKVIVDTSTASYIQTPTTQTQIFTKSAGAGQGYYQGVGDTLYMGDGVDLKKYVLPDGTSWNWGIVAPATQPGVTVVSSGSAAVTWAASTFWSTMGLVYDTTSGTIQQLISVNATTTNTTQFGTTGNGQPNWSQTPGVTTNDGGTLVWTNFGPITLWKANQFFNNASLGGVAFGSTSGPCIIYDPGTKACFINAQPGVGGISGNTPPNFSAANGPGQHVQDNQVRWFYVGTNKGTSPGLPGTWKPSNAYSKLGTISNDDAATSITEPVSLASGLPTSPTVYWQVVSTAGTSAGSGTAPPFGTVLGDLTSPDGDMVWMNVGTSVSWVAGHFYTGWTAPGSIFSALKDTNGNFQICTTTGTSDAVAHPSTTYGPGSITVSTNGTQTTYTGTFTSPPASPVNKTVVISGFTNAGNNGSFQVVSFSSTVLVVNSTTGVIETHSATIIYNPWGVGYGTTTVDGTATFTCVGIASAWAASTKWFLPSSGFYPPNPFGGASVLDANNNVEFIINSGLGGSVAPTWAALPTSTPPYTADGGTALVLTQTTVSGTSTTYTGTITGGAANALAGQTFLIGGFTISGNNILIQVTASTATTLVCTTTSQANETHAGTASHGALWYNLVAFTTQSLSWTRGHVWAYSYKARALTDFYSTAVSGILPIPPGANPSVALPTPTGSQTGAVSTTSPVNISIQVSSNAGAVVTISGMGSTDTQVDTIVIWRDLDGGGPSNMFELTEIPAPKPINGIAQPWMFKDYLSDTVINEFISAPINHQNDPPPAGFLPMAYHFERIWGAVGNFVYTSGGPDVVTGNPNEAFNPDDFFEFPSPVTRVVPTATGILVFLTSDIYAILGGPAFTSFFPTPMVPGIGLLHYNALDVHGGVIYLYTADNQFISLDPSGGAQRMGGPIADKLALFDATKVFVTVHESGNDNAVFVADGVTGWYRLNPSQFPNGTSVWSPFAAATGGAGAVLSIEVSPGVHRLLVGGVGSNTHILQRDFSTYQDNGTNYTCSFTMGNINLVSPGQIAGLTFINLRATRVGTAPTCAFLLNEISGSFTTFLSSQAYPWQIYGSTLQPTSLFSNAYYFRGAGVPALAEHLQVKVSFPAENFANEVLSLTVFGVIEQSPEV